MRYALEKIVKLFDEYKKNSDPQYLLNFADALHSLEEEHGVLSYFIRLEKVRIRRLSSQKKKDYLESLWKLFFIVDEHLVHNEMTFRFMKQQYTSAALSSPDVFTPPIPSCDKEDLFFHSPEDELDPIYAPELLPYSHLWVASVIDHIEKKYATFQFPADSSRLPLILSILEMMIEICPLSLYQWTPSRAQTQYLLFPIFEEASPFLKHWIENVFYQYGLKGMASCSSPSSQSEFNPFYPLFLSSTRQKHVLMSVPHFSRGDLQHLYEDEIDIVQEVQNVLIFSRNTHNFSQELKNLRVAKHSKKNIIFFFIALGCIKFKNIEGLKLVLSFIKDRQVLKELLSITLSQKDTFNPHAIFAFLEEDKDILKTWDVIEYIQSLVRYHLDHQALLAPCFFAEPLKEWKVCYRLLHFGHFAPQEPAQITHQLLASLQESVFAVKKLLQAPQEERNFMLLQHMAQQQFDLPFVQDILFHLLTQLPPVLSESQQQLLMSPILEKKGPLFLKISCHFIQYPREDSPLDTVVYRDAQKCFRDMLKKFPLRMAQIIYTLNLTKAHENILFEESEQNYRLKNKAFLAVVRLLPPKAYKVHPFRRWISSVSEDHLHRKALSGSFFPASFPIPSSSQERYETLASDYLAIETLEQYGRIFMSQEYLRVQKALRSTHPQDLVDLFSSETPFEADPISPLKTQLKNILYLQRFFAAYDLICRSDDQTETLLLAEDTLYRKKCLWFLSYHAQCIKISPSFLEKLTQYVQQKFISCPRQKTYFCEALAAFKALHQPHRQGFQQDLPFSYPYYAAFVRTLVQDYEKNFLPDLLKKTLRTALTPGRTYAQLTELERYCFSSHMRNDKNPDSPTPASCRRFLETAFLQHQTEKEVKNFMDSKMILEYPSFLKRWPMMLYYRNFKCFLIHCQLVILSWLLWVIPKLPQKIQKKLPLDLPYLQSLDKDFKESLWLCHIRSFLLLKETNKPPRIIHQDKDECCRIFLLEDRSSNLDDSLYRLDGLYQGFFLPYAEEFLYSKRKRTKRVERKQYQQDEDLSDDLTQKTISAQKIRYILVH